MKTGKGPLSSQSCRKAYNVESGKYGRGRETKDIGTHVP